MDEMKKKKRNKRLGLVLFILFNAVVIAATAYVDFGAGGASSSNKAMLDINPLYFLLGLACFVVALAAESFKYFLMMDHTLGKAKARQAFEVAALGKYYDNITPLGSGGQPFQIVYLIKQGFDAGQATALPVAGFICLQCAFIVIALAVLIFGRSAMDAAAIKVVAIAGLLFYMFIPLLILFCAVAPAVTEKIIDFSVGLGGRFKLVKAPKETSEKVKKNLYSSITSMSSIMHRRGLFLKGLGLSAVYQVALCSMPYFVLRAFGNTLPYSMVFCPTVYIYLCITFIPTPGNSGVAEGSFYALFSVLGPGNLFWAMLVWRFFCYYMFLIVGIAIVSKGFFRKKNIRT
jgi:hypothetical protein